MAEADRCLNCGGCSECMQCVVACQAGAIAHELGPEKLETKGRSHPGAGFSTL